MNQLITITTNAQGAEAVSARELYQSLGFDGSQWARWAKKNIVSNPFAFEGIDWQGFDTMSNGNSTKDYVLTTDFAERLAMLARTEKGEEVRRWFQAIKNKALKLTAPMSQIELIIQSAQQLQRQERELAEVKATQAEQGEMLRQIDARTTTRPDYFTIAGYANLNHISVNLKVASSVGQRATRICRERGLMMDSCNDPRWGSVNMYPTQVLAEVFSRPIA